MAGLKESLGKAGRTQEWLVDPVSNVLFQSDANDTSVSPATGTVTVFTPLIIRYSVDETALEDATVYTVPTGYSLEVLDAWLFCTAAEASGVVDITDGTTDITNQLTAAVDKALVRATTIDDAASTIAAGGTLVVTRTGGTNDSAVEVFIVCKLSPA